MTRPGEIDATGEEYRPLVSRVGLVGLGAAVVVVLCLLLPSSQRRQDVALEVLPDALSLIYLDLSLTRRPEDAQLRFQVVKKTVQAGQLTNARKLLEPLLVPGTKLFENAKEHSLATAAEELRLDIDRKIWAAIDPNQAEARKVALAQVVSDIDAMSLAGAPLERVQAIAELYQSLAQPVRAAELLDGLARRVLPEFEAQVDAAETAHLQADQGMRAVDLQLFAAEHAADGLRLMHVLRALELARGVMQPEGLLRLAEDLRSRFGPEEPQLMAASLDLAESVDVKLGYQLALQILKARPADVSLHRRIAKLAEWNGNSLRALDEYVWLTRHEGRAEDRARAIELAKANWDLPLLRSLLSGAAQKATELADIPGPTDPRETRPDLPRARRVKKKNRPAGRVSFVAPHEVRRARACGGRPVRLAGRTDGTTRAPSSRIERLRAQLNEMLSLDEALGDTRAAIAAVDAALRGELGGDAATWELKITLLQRAGKPEAAAATQAELVARFPTRARALALANLQLGLGNAKAALATLNAAPGPRDDAFLRQLLEVAWEVGDLGVTERTATEIVALPSASAWDVARLYQLQRTKTDPSVAMATAVAGFDRFKNAEMLRLVIESTLRLNDDARVANLLGEAERFGGFRDDPGYWQQRITLHQRLAYQAFEKREFVAAKRELVEAEKALTRAPENAPGAETIYDLLWSSQNAQALAIALESNDKKSLARIFDTYGTELPVRQQVYILHRLDRDADAYALAKLGAADPSLSRDDRAALAADQPGTASSATPADRPDYVRASSDFFDSEGLQLWTNKAQLELDGESLGLKAGAAITQITPQNDLRLLQPSAAREIQAELGGRIASTELTGGMRVRDSGVVRPFGTLRQAVFGERGDLLALRGSFNTLTFDSAQLRLAGATDEVAVEASVPFGGGFYATGRVAGNRYLTLEREYLGAGVSVDAGAGKSFKLPSDFGRASVRIAGRYAPRFRDADTAATADPRQPALWMPETTGFTGVGASLARGELDVPKEHDPRFRFLLDGTVGALWPSQKFGWSGKVGIGSGLFGNDQLSASLITGNVVGSVAYWSLQAGYAVGL